MNGFEKFTKATLAIGLVFAAALPTLSCAKDKEQRLLTIPTKVYKTVTNPKENVEGWVYFLILESENERKLVPAGLTLAYSSKGKRVRTENLSAAELHAVDRTDYPPARLTGTPPSTPTFWPHAFRIHAYVPTGLEIDSVEAELRFSDGVETGLARIKIPVATYRQKTPLIFPFKGKGLVTQGGVTEGGHRNRSGLYAIDALGLTDTHAPVLKAESAVQDYAGWARPIIAPSDGKVVFTRGDRPDQPVEGVSDPKYHAPEFASGGDPGNAVVIDHGNGEFSMIAHLRKDSVRVDVGDVVTKGQILGLLGNSGDTSGPHVHYQLQDGPNWEYSNGLPVEFENIERPSRGSYFNAK